MLLLAAQLGPEGATTTESAFGAAREIGVGKTGVFRELGEKSEGTGVKFGRSRAEGLRSSGSKKGGGRSTRGGEGRS